MIIMKSAILPNTWCLFWFANYCCVMYVMKNIVTNSVLSVCFAGFYKLQPGHQMSARGSRVSYTLARGFDSVPEFRRKLVNKLCLPACVTSPLMQNLRCA